MRQYQPTSWIILIFFPYLEGQIGYAILPMIARGQMLGLDQPVIIHMLDIPSSSEALGAVKMELIDSALPLLRGSCLFFVYH